MKQHVHIRAKVGGMHRVTFRLASSIHRVRRHPRPDRQASPHARSELRKRPKVDVPNMLRSKVFLHALTMKIAVGRRPPSGVPSLDGAPATGFRAVASGGYCLAATRASHDGRL
jgi:hypothetical protein